MSVCRKLPDGTVQKIAGHTILLDANAQEVREGSVAIPSIPEYTAADVQVTFSSPMPDTDYAVSLSGFGNANTTLSSDVYGLTTTGFKIRIGRPYQGSSSAITAHYIAWKPVKLTDYTDIQNKVNNPDSTPTEDSMNLVTSDGVWQAIKNASAVFKGTSTAWNALPAADKAAYDVALLTDIGVTKAVDRTDGSSVDVSNLKKIVPCTLAQYEAMATHDPDTYYMITDDVTPASLSHPIPDWDNKVLIPFNQTQSDTWAVPADGMLVGLLRAAVSSLIPEGDYSVVNAGINSIPLWMSYHYKNNFADDNKPIQLVVSNGDVLYIERPHDHYTIERHIYFVPWK